MSRRTRAVEDYPCTYHKGQRCLHTTCRLATLPPKVAVRLERNFQAQDYARNWGLLLYDPKQHGRDQKRRTILARIIRGMRDGTVDYGQACVGGCWAGASCS